MGCVSKCYVSIVGELGFSRYCSELGIPVENVPERKCNVPVPQRI